MFLWRKKKKMSTFSLKNMPYLDLCFLYELVLTVQHKIGCCREVDLAVPEVTTGPHIFL